MKELLLVRSILFGRPPVANKPRTLALIAEEIQSVKTAAATKKATDIDNAIETIFKLITLTNSKIIFELQRAKKTVQSLINSLGFINYRCFQHSGNIRGIRLRRFAYCLVLLLSLTGCSEGVHSEKTNKDVYVSNPLITDDINLKKVRETITDAKGELTLKVYNKVNETIKIGPIEMIIKEVKVMHFVPDHRMIDYFYGYTHEEEFDFVKVRVEVKNTSKEEVEFTPVDALLMNSGETKTWEDDIYLEELIGKIEGNGIKKGNMGFILESTNDIEWMELLTSDAVDKIDGVIEQAQYTKIDF